jgi:hypothetical protein
LFDSVSIAKDPLKDNILDFKKKISEDYRLSYGVRNKVRGKVQENPDRVLFTLQQNELVYLPTDSEDSVLRMSNDEFVEWIKSKDNKQAFCKRIYKVVKFTGKDCFFIPHNYANSISIAKDLSEEEWNDLKEKHKDKSIPNQEKNYEEFGSFGTSAKTEVNESFVKELVLKKKFDGEKPLKIQDTCIKIQIDWLGNIILTT